jgi:pimeloyl-ACP methyl ester carboxylesterase
MFQPIVDDVQAFSKHYTVYTFDRRGRGDSGDGQSYDPRLEVEDIRAIIDAAGGSAFVYGHSSGAVLALETAIAYPDRVKKLLVYDIPYSENADEQAASIQAGDRIRSLLADGKESRNACPV